jgi:hypothetical protein
VLDALVLVLKNLPDENDWREDRQLQDLFHVARAGTREFQRKRTIDALRTAIGQPQSDRTRENMALILAEFLWDFGQKDDTAAAILRTMSEKGSRWSAARGALALAQLGDDTGWKDITQKLEEKTGAYEAAAVLAQQGRPGLGELTAKYGEPGGLDGLTTKMENVINRRIECDRAPSYGCQPFANCFQERYARWLVASLDQISEAATTKEPIGGECTLGAQGGSIEA